MSHQTIFRQDLHANDVIMEDLTEQLQSRVPANTPMGLRAVVILNQAQRSGSGAATIAPVNTISKTVARKPTGGVARRKNLGDALGKGAKAQLQQRLIVDVKKGKLFKPSIASVDGDESKKADEPKNSETKKPETDLEVYGTSAGGRLLGDEAYFTAFGKPIEAAKVREENIKNAANPKFHSSHVQNEERVITQVAKLYYFYYMDITPEHVRDIAGRLAMTGDDERMGILQGQFEELKVKFEKGIWGSKAFIDFVEDVVDSHDNLSNRDGEGYDDMTLGRKYTFWFHEWSIPFVVKILAPLKTAIRLEDALQSKGWSDYIKRVFVKACISTYEHRCQYRTKAEKKNVDKVQILKDIRSAAVRAIRPPIEEIPTHYGGEQDTGRRAAKQASKESDAESLMSVASTVEDYSSKDE